MLDNFQFRWDFNEVWRSAERKELSVILATSDILQPGDLMMAGSLGFHFTGFEEHAALVEEVHSAFSTWMNYFSPFWLIYPFTRAVGWRANQRLGACSRHLSHWNGRMQTYEPSHPSSFMSLKHSLIIKTWIWIWNTTTPDTHSSITTYF